MILVGLLELRFFQRMITQILNLVDFTTSHVFDYLFSVLGRKVRVWTAGIELSAGTRNK